MTSNTKPGKLLSILLILALALMLASCGAKKEKEKKADPADEQATEEVVEEEEEEETEDTEEAEESAAEVVKVIDEIDTDDTDFKSLQIESITLYDDGTVAIVPNEDLLRNAETNDEIRDGAMHPFDDSGEVEDIFLVRYGSEGYRTIICLMEDGTLSAMSAKELIEDRIAIIWDNLTGRDTYVSIEDRLEEDTWYVYGITEDGEEIDLDFSLDF